MKKLKLAVVALGLVSMSQAAFSASVSNGNFNAGLAGWNTQGNISWDGNVVTLNSNGGVGTGAFGGTNGSILSQTINAKAGDKISFDYNFKTTDYLPYNDFSVLIADGTKALASVATVGNYGTTGWLTYTFIALTDFQDLSFVVSNAGDFGVNSYLQIDNVGVSNVPVPAAVWLFGSALTGLVGVGKRRKMQVAA